MFFRTLLIFLQKRFLKRTGFGETTVIRMRVLPTDLDFLWHMNNGVYFSLMDFGRWNMIFRNGLFDLCMKRGWISVVAGETIKFRRSLELWDKFELHTRALGHDEKNFYIEQKFFREGELMATGLVKVRFIRKKGGPLEVKDVLEAINHDGFENSASGLGAEWLAFDKKYLA
jgi:acyl-CoA thioesterase FadM